MIAKANPTKAVTKPAITFIAHLRLSTLSL
jgi:hypothetical protein